MAFNYCISNPAFNISEDKNVAGTGGNTTLYKTATRHDFTDHLKEGGTLVNIALKGIIPDLTHGFFRNYQVDWIHLMDNIDVWPYNTCIFSIRKTPRTSNPKILGGLATKIYVPNPEDCFPFVYYSSSNNGMSRYFDTNGKNKVIRQLPGKGRDTVKYDYTNKDILSGPKFAFYVLESKKSYTVTSEPIFGGTICYVPLSSEEQAARLKLFVEKNKVFAEYVKRMKVRGHAFALRHMKKFDLSQIVTGEEIPVEWGINATDLSPPTVLTNDTINVKDRVKQLGEVFTPTQLVTYVIDLIKKYDNNAFVNPTATFLDSMAGNGQFLNEVLIQKIKSGIDFETALNTIYGVDLIPNNIKECRNRLLGSCEDLRHVVTRNIVCHDALSYDYSFNGTDLTDSKLREQQLGIPDVTAHKKSKKTAKKTVTFASNTALFFE
jgi:hypothetical protein